MGRADYNNNDSGSWQGWWHWPKNRKFGKRSGSGDRVYCSSCDDWLFRDRLANKSYRCKCGFHFSKLEEADNKNVWSGSHERKAKSNSQNGAQGSTAQTSATDNKSTEAIELLRSITESIADSDVVVKDGALSKALALLQSSPPVAKKPPVYSGQTLVQAQAATSRAEAEAQKALTLRDKAKLEYDSRCQKYTECLTKLRQAQVAESEACKLVNGNVLQSDQLNVEAILEGKQVPINLSKFLCLDGAQGDRADVLKTKREQIEAAVQKRFQDFSKLLISDFGEEAKKWRNECEEAKPKRTAEIVIDEEPPKRMRTDTSAEAVAAAESDVKTTNAGGSAKVDANVALGKAVSEEQAAAAELRATVLSDAAKIKLVAPEADVAEMEVEAQSG